MKLADKVAAVGYNVVASDFLYCDPYTTEKPLSIWIQSHGEGKGFEDAKQVIEALKDKGISAFVAAEVHSSCCAITSITLVKNDDIKEVKAPIAILAAETDKISPWELIKKFEEIFS